MIGSLSGQPERDLAAAALEAALPAFLAAGWLPPNSEADCPWCEGSGHEEDLDFERQDGKPCAHCNGTGIRVAGWTPPEEAIDAGVPALRRFGQTYLKDQAPEIVSAVLKAALPAFLAAGWLPPDSPPITPEVRLHASPAEVAYGLACDDRDIWKARAEAAGWRPPDE